MAHKPEHNPYNDEELDRILARQNRVESKPAGTATPRDNDLSGGERDALSGQDRDPDRHGRTRILISEVQREALNFLDGYAFIDNPIQKKILQRTIVESAWVFAGLQLRGISATTNEPAEEEIDVVDLGEVTLDQAFQIEQEVENLETPVDQNLDSLFTTLITGPGSGDLIDPGEAGASGVSVLGVTGGGLLGAGSGDAAPGGAGEYPANPAGQDHDQGAGVYPDGGHNDGGDIGD
jgi:hypothetical protein